MGKLRETAENRDDSGPLRSNLLILMIGTNSKFLFLYSPQEHKIQIVPIANVARITLDVAQSPASRSVAPPPASGTVPTDKSRSPEALHHSGGG